MKKLIILLIITAISLFSLALNGTYTMITKEGVRGVKIGASNLKSVKQEFPKGKTTKQVSRARKIGYTGRDLAPNMEVFLYEPKTITKTYSVKKDGISFEFDDLGKLFLITIWGKGKYRTDKGIVLGKSTFKDLDLLYGKEAWNTFRSKMAKKHENLIFFAPDATLIIKENDDVPNQYEDLIIEKIELWI